MVPLLLSAVLATTARSAAAQAAIARGTVHTDTIFAQSLGTRKQLVVYLPPSYATAAASGAPLSDGRVPARRLGQ